MCATVLIESELESKLNAGARRKSNCMDSRNERLNLLMQQNVIGYESRIKRFE